MELTTGGTDRYKKIEADFGAIDKLLVDMFIRFHKKRPKLIVIDIDITDDPLHGNQARLLRGVLLHPLLYILRAPSAWVPAPRSQSGFCGGSGGRTGEDYLRDSREVERHSHYHTRGRGVLPGRAYEVV